MPKAMPSAAFTQQEAIAFLRNAYESAGYIRVKEDNRRSPPLYSYELRFSAKNRKHAELIKKAMRVLGFKARREFQKHNRTIIPYYGKDHAAEFISRVKPRRKNSLSVFKR